MNLNHPEAPKVGPSLPPWRRQHRYRISRLALGKEFLAVPNVAAPKCVGLADTKSGGRCSDRDQAGFAVEIERSDGNAVLSVAVRCREQTDIYVTSIAAVRLQHRVRRFPQSGQVVPVHECCISSLGQTPREIVGSWTEPIDDLEVVESDYCPELVGGSCCFCDGIGKWWPLVCLTAVGRWSVE